MADALMKDWGKSYGLTLTQVKKLQRLCELWASQAIHKRNCDPHRTVTDPSDKNACSAAWEDDCDRTEQRLTAMAIQLGFDRVDYGSGPYPVFGKGTHHGILVPHLFPNSERRSDSQLDKGTEGAE